jgi:hypothetical protein
VENKKDKKSLALDVLKAKRKEKQELQAKKVRKYFSKTFLENCLLLFRVSPFVYALSPLSPPTLGKENTCFCFSV